MLKKGFKDKRAVLAVSFLALFSLVILASALRDVTFRPVRHFSHKESQSIGAPFDAMVERVADISLEKQIALLVMLFLFSVLVVALLPPEMRKRLLKQLFRMMMGFLLLLYLLKIKPNFFADLFPDSSLEAGQDTLAQTAASPPPVFEPPQISGWISFLITFGILLLAAFLFWRLNRWWMLRKATTDVPPALQEIAEAVCASLQNLSSDGSAQDKIIQCYADMSRVVDVRRGLYREFAMTPAEFAVRLENAGLPREPVTRLTRLFESVRYGAQISLQRDVDEAIACLTSILKYCGGPPL
jgi:hypothetical protein